jgi:ribonucleoside-diphosphate reductase alpha chain
VPLQNLVDKFRGVHFEPAGMTSNAQIPIATSLVDYIFRWLEMRFLEPPQLPSPPKPASASKGVRARKSTAKQPPRAGRGHSASSVQAPARDRARDTSTGLACPDCGSILVFAEGCLVCRSCGYNKCG